MYLKDKQPLLCVRRIGLSGQPTPQIETKYHEKSPRNQKQELIVPLIRRQAQALLKSHPHP